jgi:hypothetical protein
MFLQVQINSGKHNCASTSRVQGTRASQAWVVERDVPVLKKKANMGATELQSTLEDKYAFKIKNKAIWLE